MDKIIVDLTEDLNVSAGIIVPQKTGVIYTNQTAGTGCSHPEVEGFYIPTEFINPYISGDPIEDLWGLSDEQIQRFLNELEIEDDFELVSEKELIGFFSWRDWHMKGKAYEGREAWVSVRVKETTKRKCLEGIKNRIVIITYCNSD